MPRVEPSGVCVVVIGENDVVRSVSLDAPRELGNAAVGRVAFDGWTAEEREPLERALCECRAAGQVRLVGASGGSEPGRRWKHVFVPVQETGEVVWILRDLAHYDAITSDARRFEVLLRHSSEVLNLLDRDLRVLYRSPSPERPLGYADGLVGRSALEILHPDDHTAALTALGKVLEGPGAVGRAIVRAKHADGTWRVLHATATNLLDQREIQAILLAYRDITEERQAEERLFAASRLASIGTLAASVGHEINNPLTYVIANLDYVFDRLLSPSSTDLPALRNETLDLIAEARDGAQRIAKIVADLKLLSAPERDELSPVDADAAAERALTIVGSQLRARARVIKRLRKPGLALAAESRLVQALINLLLNAAQALPANFRDNEIEMATSTTGEHVIVSVRDNGSGMSADVRQQIFEPYFTTKSAGGGSGLGLWVVKRIAETCGGRIEVTSEPGQGSTFSLVLRRAWDQDARPPTSRGAPPGAVKKGRVLVVEDELPIAAAIRRALAPHDVTLAASGHEVLERLSLGERWDVIVSDVVMPGMSGLELQQRVAEMVPELAQRFVLMSGGAFDHETRKRIERLAIGIVYLSKPLDFGELHAVIGRLIGG